MFNRKKTIVGIDIGSSSIKLVQLNEKKGAYSVVNAGIIALPPEAIVDNTLMDTASIVEAIKNLVKSLGVRATDAACSISGNSVIIRKIPFPTMTSDELEDQIQWEAEQYIPFDINDVNIDFQILSQDAFDPSKMNVLLVASKKETINDYIAVFTEAGLRLSIVDVDSFAVQNVFEFNHDVSPEDVSALVNIGASITNINIVKAGISLFTRDVQLGGNLYTEEIQKHLGISGIEAEQIKLSGDYLGQPHLADIVSRVNETIATELHRSLDFYNSSAGDDRITRIVLSGGASKTASLADAIRARVDVAVENINPFRNIKYSEKQFDVEYLREIGPLATVAVGLAMRRVGDK